MTEQVDPVDQVDPSVLADLWIRIPGLDESTPRWAEDQGRAAAILRGLPEARGKDIAAFLAGLVGVARPEWVDRRMAFLAHPSMGAAVWDLTAFDAEVDPSDVVTSVVEGQLTHDVTAFSHGGVEGHQALSFSIDEPGSDPGGDGAPVVGSAVLALALRHHQPATLVARCRTAHLEALAASVTSMQYLLCAEALAEP